MSQLLTSLQKLAAKKKVSKKSDKSGEGDADTKELGKKASSLLEKLARFEKKEKEEKDEDEKEEEGKEESEEKEEKGEKKEKGEKEKGKKVSPMTAAFMRFRQMKGKK